MHVFELGGLQSGGLQSRATELGSRNALIALGEGAGVMRTLILMYLGLEAGGLQSRATNLGSRNALFALVEGAGVMRTRILMHSR